MKHLLALFLAASSIPTLRAADGFEEVVAPFLAKHCVACHGEKEQKGDLRLDTLKPSMADAADRTAWKAVMDRVRAGEMPPAKQPRPAKADLESATAWIQGRITAAEKARQGKEGRVVLRRLNRTEYENTIRDLMGVQIDLAESLPDDALSHGFDTVGEALNISPVHLERYLAAARKALDAGISLKPKPETKSTAHAFYDLRTGKTDQDAKINEEALGKLRILEDGSQVTFAQGFYGGAIQVAHGIRIPAAGYYNVTLEGAAFQSVKDIAVSLYNVPRGSAFGTDQRLLGLVDYKPGSPQAHSYRVWLEPGDHLRMLAIGLPSLSYDTKAKGPVAEYAGPGFAVKRIAVEGPLNETWPPRGQRLLFDAEAAPPKGQEKNVYAKRSFISIDPMKDAARLLPGFLSAAFRRPVTAEKAAPYLALVESQLADGATYEVAMRAAATAALCSPDFLFLLEAPGRLDCYELAARLSYFLARTAPDAELLALAAAGTLGTPSVLRGQTERLLKHPNAARFHADFTDGWLDLRNIKATDPDKVFYPEFDKLLETSILNETRLFFAEVLNGGHSAKAFVDSDFAMLNERLAKHYGILGVEGVAFRKVPLKPEYHRGGVLTHASVLKVSANGSSTSPVIRGVYVLERFLGQRPSPPPPGIPAVEPDIRGAKTLREILAKHRDNETCAGCHRTIDPPGFALESFDVIGGWREKFRILPEKGPRKYALGLPVDASGEWPDGRPFTGFDEFRSQLRAEPDRFVACLTKKLIAFGTGHTVGVADSADIAAIVAASAKRNHDFRELIHAVVQSDLFRTK